MLTLVRCQSQYSPKGDAGLTGMSEPDEVPFEPDEVPLYGSLPGEPPTCTALGAMGCAIQYKLSTQSPPSQAMRLQGYLWVSLNNEGLQAVALTY